MFGILMILDVFLVVDLDVFEGVIWDVLFGNLCCCIGYELIVCVVFVVCDMLRKGGN